MRVLKHKNQALSIRYDWVDTLKFLGIFAIYLGHCGESAGKLYPFVFLYHVPLFFFISGFFANNSIDVTLKEYAKKKFKQLIIPYIAFTIIHLISITISRNYGITEIKPLIISSILGIRNTLAAASLWFIPCLFVISILYFMLTKMINNKIFILFISIGCFILTQTVFQNNPLTKPSYIWNIDSALYYMIYYTLGALIFKKLTSFRYSSLKMNDKIIFIIASILMLFITIISYFKGGEYIYSKLPYILHNTFLFKDFYNVIISLAIIYFNLCLAYLIKDITFFQKIGANTLGLCFTENLINEYLNIFIAMIGLSLRLINPIASFLCISMSIDSPLFHLMLYW